MRLRPRLIVATVVASLVGALLTVVSPVGVADEATAATASDFDPGFIISDEQFFAGGAIGSALGAWVFAHHGWHAALLTGMAFPAAALLYWGSEWALRRRLTQSARVHLP